MRIFLKKILVFFLSILLLPSLLILSLELQFKHIDISNIYPKYLKLNIDKKKLPLDILIAGDSRAERQIIPDLLKNESHENILNLGISSGDVNRLRDFIVNRDEAKSLFDKKTILVLSASNWQINDNYQTWGYLSYSTFKYLDFFEKFEILKDKKDYLRYVLAIHKHNLRNIFNKWSYDSEIDSLGYFPIYGDISLINKQDLDKTIQNQIYLLNDINDNGLRWKEFKKSVEFFSKIFDKVIIINNPVTDIWKNYIDNTHIDDFNKNFVKRTENFIRNKNLSNTLIWDFYQENDIELNDNNFYDTHHLNKSGSIIFSKKIREKLSGL